MKIKKIYWFNKLDGFDQFKFIIIASFISIIYFPHKIINFLYTKLINELEKIRIEFEIEELV